MTWLRTAITAALIVATTAPALSSDVPNALVRAIIHVESRGNPNVTGRAGEIGLMQIKLKTARGLGYRGTRRALYHPATNIIWGTRYLAIAWRKARGNVCVAATLYNAGLGAAHHCAPYGKRVVEAMR